MRYHPFKILSKFCWLFFCFTCTYQSGFAQTKILFDATKAESAGNADWVIDADNHNLDWNPGAAICGTGGTSYCHQSNAQRIPMPAQSGITAATPETYWEGGLSAWAVDCANKGYTVESLPYNAAITYGNAANPQDLSNYKVYIVCEPNILFTATEKTAILNFIQNGGSLFMISDHGTSDRNNDGYDSPQIWNDLMQSNSTGNTNPFGIIFDEQNFSETSTSLAPLPATDSILHGPMGNVAMVHWSGGNTMTINPAANPNVKAVIYRNAVKPPTGNSNIMAAYSRYGNGKVAAIGDSSPCDDGTGDALDNLYTGYNGDVPPNHRNLLMNITIWLAASDKLTYTFTGDGYWNNPNNWSNNTVPPLTLPAPNAIVINPSGQCILNVTQPQHVSAGASFTIAPGKPFLIPGLLHIQ